MEKINLKDQIDDYLRYSQVERGLSDNTINAYRQDLEEFRTFVENEGMASWPTEASDVDAFLARQQPAQLVDLFLACVNFING